ncbi:MAG: DNA mismatch repair protein MutS [Fimbriimonadaceae bacterium]
MSAPRTPMLQQYFSAKAEHPGVLLAMRVGDFYEFYGDDAEVAASALEITLTGREDAGNGRIPMAGVPFHSVEKYLARLIAQGYKVAICDQLEDPKSSKGLVKRGVTRVLTPGTVIEDSMLPAGGANFLAALCLIDGRIGLATLDPSTGEFAVTELEGPDATDQLIQELVRIHPSEVLVPPQAGELSAAAGIGLNLNVTERPALRTERAAEKLMAQLRVTNLQGFGCAEKPCAVVAAGMILAYAESVHLPLNHVASVTTYEVDGFMRLDAATRRSLELTANMIDGGRRLTLLEVLDQTVTRMGSRLLRRWIDQPLLEAETIRSRQDSIERLTKHAMARADLREGLQRLNDLERLVSRASAGIAGPRDLAALRSSLGALPALADPLRILGVGRIQELREEMSDHSDVFSLLERALVTDPPHSVRDGGTVRAGFDPELDKLRDLSQNGKSYIASLETKERVKTGLTNLKVGYNSVFGYYLEVPKSQIARVPAEYIRKQTTANAERYITAELKEHESLVLGAEEKATALEVDLFGRLRARVAEHDQALLRTARALAEIDVYASLADVAVRRKYVRPEMSERDELRIEGGRHPVVEAAGAPFVPNDADIDAEEGRVLVLTGPNMAGKSTYLRQIALIALMAQIGSFVPTRSCRLGLCDRVFARIGARDELASGQSTFMVEMSEAANILNHATERSLVILDEVGRGTSTYDGLAIAWAILERLVEIGAKTLFATHYHQLNALAEQTPAVRNLRASVEEVGEDVVWTHKVLPGGTDRSYGIHVARAAGVPRSVLTRARSILDELEDKAAAPRAAPTTQKLQLTLFEAEPAPVMKELEGLDVNTLTPVEALTILDAWKRKFGTLHSK